MWRVAAVPSSNSDPLSSNGILDGFLFHDFHSNCEMIIESQVDKVGYL
jgi:hypothetical protein